MLALSPCLNLLYPESGTGKPHVDGIRRAADEGFRWVEMWGWRETDTIAIGAALRATGVRLNCLTIDPSEPIVDPERHDRFLTSVERSTRVAAELDCPFVVALAGDAMPDVPRAAQHRSVVEALRKAAPIAERSGVTIILENLNTRVDHVGHYLDQTAEALDIIDEVGHRSVRMLYDLYHSAVMGEDPSQVLAGRLDRVAHVQIADAPGRHEPGSGEIDWTRVIGWLAASGYDGRLGLEYSPTTDRPASLAFIRRLVEGLSPAP